jgi:hypothetical protein
MPHGKKRNGEKDNTRLPDMLPFALPCLVLDSININLWILDNELFNSSIPVRLSHMPTINNHRRSLSETRLHPGNPSTDKKKVGWFEPRPDWLT